MINRSAEAARYAILARLAPSLRHNVAGLLQPVRMLTTVLERRLLKPDFDATEFAANVTALNVVTKEALVGCRAAFDWLDESDNTKIDLRSGIEELRKLLVIYFAESHSQVINQISEYAAAVPQRFVRSVIAGVLLAFCDEQAGHSTLTIILDSANGLLFTSVLNTNREGRVQSDAASPVRLIDWQDIEALASDFDITFDREPGSLRLSLPTPSEYLQRSS